MCIAGETLHIVVFGPFKTGAGRVKSLRKPVPLGLTSNQILHSKVRGVLRNGSMKERNKERKEGKKEASKKKKGGRKDGRKKECLTN